MRYLSLKGKGFSEQLCEFVYCAARDASVEGEGRPLSLSLVSRGRNSIAMQRFAKSHVAPNSHDSSGSGVGGIAQPRARTQTFAPAFVPRAATHTHVGARGRCCLVHPEIQRSPPSLPPSLLLSLFFSE